MADKFWLLKAEPDTRIVKGKDVKFSVDDFERVNTSPWEGVRNYEARNLMKEMKIGEKAVFYHSNCKIPDFSVGIAGFAEVSKEAYPDYTAWDESHPYYDAKSNKDSPRWFMVDLTFTIRAKHFIPLALLRHIADSSSDDPSEEIQYIGQDGVKAIKGMELVTRGRLSVQRVGSNAWETIQLLAENGGWEKMDLKPRKKLPAKKTRLAATAKPSRATTKVVKKKAQSKATAVERDSSPLSSLEDSDVDLAVNGESGTTSHKRKGKIEEEDVPRRSTRRKVATS